MSEVPRERVLTLASEFPFDLLCYFHDHESQEAWEAIKSGKITTNEIVETFRQELEREIEYVRKTGKLKGWEE